MMKEPSNIVVLITTSREEKAQSIAGLLLNQRKAACVNIVPQVTSIFRWEGNIEDEKESLLVVKTRAELFPELKALVSGIHSYEVPEIIAIPIVDGNAEYLEWIGTETEAE